MLERLNEKMRHRTRVVRTFPNLARPQGLEPRTPRFEAWCSIQLSYGRIARIVLVKWSGKFRQYAK